MLVRPLLSEYSFFFYYEPKYNINRTYKELNSLPSPIPVQTFSICKLSACQKIILPQDSDGCKDEITFMVP